MFRGVYTATSGMTASGRKQELLTNNLANAETPGYKSDDTALRAFPELLMKQMNGRASNPTSLGSIHGGVYAQESIPSFLQGDLRETGNETDLALIDTAVPINNETQRPRTLVFAVQADNGDIRYTRNGQFTVNNEGFLTTSNGEYVLNENLERISVNPDAFQVTGNGQILEDRNGALQSLWIGYTEEPEKFVKEGTGLLRWEGDEETAPVTIANLPEGANNAFVRQGFIEQSNVDVTKTMTEMMSTYRLFEANQKVLQAYDRSLEKTVNDIGKLY
jgi:flagellar basal-body rod protein FlgF